MDRTTELMPDFRRMNRTEITGDRTRHVLTFNPNSAKPGEEIYVNIPKLKADSVLVPDSMALVFDFKNSNTKSWFRNNLGKLLQKRLEIRLAGEKVYDNSGESLLEVYKDLWLHNKQRDDMVEDGIASEATRKIQRRRRRRRRRGYRIVRCIRNKTENQDQQNPQRSRTLCPTQHGERLTYVITLPTAAEIMNAQGGESVEGYTLENIELEYESIDNIDLARKAEGLYGSERELSFEHATLMKKTEWSKDSTIINETINVPRRSMKAIVMLFTNKTKTDSEEYIYPNIEKVRVTIEGVPNAVYSQGIPKTRLYEEARRLFGTDEISHQTLTGFFKDKKFALVIDLRTASDANTYGNGAKIQNTQSGILVEITKKATTADAVCYLFVLSDGVIKITNGQLAGIKY